MLSVVFCKDYGYVLFLFLLHLILGGLPGYDVMIDFSLAVHPTIVSWHLAIKLHINLGLCTFFIDVMV